jgi:dihydrofolate synthase/folylpolyglutamate synthase
LAILEVGCGGRFDSSNIIPHKKIAVITNIGLDHLGLIGNNKEKSLMKNQEYKSKL